MGLAQAHPNNKVAICYKKQCICLYISLCMIAAATFELENKFILLVFLLSMYKILPTLPDPDVQCIS